MKTLTEKALGTCRDRVFTRTELTHWFGRSPDRVNALLRRALRSGEVQRVSRGTYVLSPDGWRQEKVDLLSLAQFIQGPSYVSLETALSVHGWIPEAVWEVASVCDKRSSRFETPFGTFTYVRIPQRTLYAGVSRINGAFVASPLKALADYVYVNKLDWRDAEAPAECLRIEHEDLRKITHRDFEELSGTYTSGRVCRFLSGLQAALLS